MKQVDLHIDELVLYGFPSGERYRIAESLASELRRLFSEREMKSEIQSRPELRTGSVEIHRGDVGEQLARAIYGSLENG